MPTPSPVCGVHEDVVSSVSALATDHAVVNEKLDHVVRDLDEVKVDVRDLRTGILRLVELQQEAALTRTHVWTELIEAIRAMGIAALQPSSIKWIAGVLVIVLIGSYGLTLAYHDLIIGTATNTPSGATTPPQEVPRASR